MHTIDVNISIAKQHYMNKQNKYINIYIYIWKYHVLENIMASNGTREQ